jgi:hypothetical protein
MAQPTVGIPFSNEVTRESATTKARQTRRSICIYSEPQVQKADTSQNE